MKGKKIEEAKDIREVKEERLDAEQGREPRGGCGLGLANTGENSRK